MAVIDNEDGGADDAVGNEQIRWPSANQSRVGPDDEAGSKGYAHGNPRDMVGFGVSAEAVRLLDGLQGGGLY